MIIEGSANWSSYRAKLKRMELESTVQNFVGPIVNIEEVPIDRLEAMAEQNNLRLTRASVLSTPQPNVDEGDGK